MFVHGNDDRGLSGFFLNPACDNANDAGVPAFARQQRHRAVVLPGQHSLGLFLHHRFNRASFFVQPIELKRNLLRLRRVLGCEQTHAKVRLAHTAACIDAWAQGKA